MEESSKQTWLTPTIILSVLAIVSAILWRLGLWGWIMSWSPWPAQLRVDKKVEYWRIKESYNGLAYVAFITITIVPWVRIMIDDFYLQMKIEGETVTVCPKEIVRMGDDRVIPRKGFWLRPNNPIGPTAFRFVFSAETSQIPSYAYIILECGIRKGRFPIRKRIDLKERHP